MQLITQEISEYKFIPFSIDSHNTYPVQFKELKVSNSKRSYLNPIHQRWQDFLQVGADYLHVKWQEFFNQQRCIRQ